MNLTAQPPGCLEDVAGQFSQTAALPFRKQRFHRTRLTVYYHSIPKIYMNILAYYYCAAILFLCILFIKLLHISEIFYENHI